MQRFFVDGGFAQVRGDVVTVLTPRALKRQEIDTAAATAALEAARAAAATPQAQAAQVKAQQRAERSSASPPASPAALGHRPLTGAARDRLAAARRAAR